MSGSTSSLGLFIIRFRMLLAWTVEIFNLCLLMQDNVDNVREYNGQL
jgi:hypothetical protein